MRTALTTHCRSTIKKNNNSLLAANSGDWLLTLPIASRGLRLDDQAVRVAFALRLGLGRCAAHTYRCGSQVDTWDLHAFVFKMAPTLITRHHVLNGISQRLPQPNFQLRRNLLISHSDGQRPDGLTLIPWQRGLSLTWDVTVVTTLADCYISASASSAGAAAEMAASRKQAKVCRVDRVVHVPADCF